MRSLFLAAALALALPAPAIAQSAEVEAILAEAGPGTRWGLVVADESGAEVLAIDPEGRFMPASNTKVFTTAAAMWAQATGRFPDAEGAGTRVRLEGADVVLEGRGDARMSAASDCTVDCLATLADAIAARTKRVRHVVGDATAFPDQRWSPGMSWNNIPFYYGTGVAALTLDDNEVTATVTAAAPGAAPAVSVSPYYSVENHARTVAGSENKLSVDRAPNTRVLVLTGTLGTEAKPVTWQLAVDDPAHYAAWRFAEMLRARGVAVSGEVRSHYRPLMAEDDPAQRTGPVARAPEEAALATIVPGPLAEDLKTINTDSQNLHSELLLRRIGAAAGSGSIADGQAVVTAMLAEAGVPPAMVSLYDGSGMSSYNRVAPRGMVRLLAWIARQPWGAQFRETLPVGGVAGTLRRRFADTPLAGKIFAKTGTLNATNALAGWVTAASGKTMIFAAYANDVPEDVRATAIMDRALLAVAAAN